MASITENRSQLKQFLTSISSIKGDLSNITAPPFVLAGKSAVEFPASWAEHPSILVAPAREENPQIRALLVLKWYLASLKRQTYTSGNEEDGVKKPLNAYLGELFIGQYEDDCGTTKLLSEQVSHHPPVTACYLWNEQNEVRAEGYTRQEVTLSSTFNIRINQIGHAIIFLDRFQEAHLVTLPQLTVKGLLSGTPYPELNGTNYISSSTGFTSKITYTGKGMFSGTKNSFQATLYQTSDPEKILYSVEGQWNSKFTIYDEHGDKMEMFDTDAQRVTEMVINDIEAQDSWESRKTWGPTITAIKEGDFKRVATEKQKVEDAQREQRRRREAGELAEWEPALFTEHRDDPIFNALVKGTGAELSADRTAGVWKFDLKKAADAKSPYHGRLTPLG